MKIQAIISLIALLGGTAVVAAPNTWSQPRGQECFKCEYHVDDYGEQYGGSYNHCEGDFDHWYPKPYCPKKECRSCEYKKDDCEYEYGGSFDHCKGDFDFWYKKPKCKGHKRGKKEREDEDEHDD